MWIRRERQVTFPVKRSIMKSIDIVIIGAGLYVCGKGTPGYGTILPAVFEWVRQGANINSVHCVATSGKSAKQLSQKASELIEKTGVTVDVRSYPETDEYDSAAYQKVLSLVEGPACAIVAVPDHLHHEVSKHCLEAGLHTLVVKPLTPTLAEGLDLRNIAKEKRLYGAVEFHKRWDKSNLILKDKIRSGSIGAPLNCWIEYSQRKTIPLSFFKDWASKTSILQYLGVHYIDLIRFATSALPRRVMAIGQKTELANQGIDTYDAIQCVIDWQMQDGQSFTETILTSWVDPNSSTAMSDQKIKFVGTKGRYEADQKERGIRINTDEAGVEHINPDFSMPYGTQNGNVSWRGYGIDSVTTFFSDVADLETGHTSLELLNEVRPTFQEALISTMVVEAAHLSLENGSSWQSIDSTQIGID